MTASKYLSETCSNLNMKRMKVNAQVTAVITLMESFGNCAVLIIISVFRGYGPFFAFFLNLILYHVILPYTFLMNTKDNKSRVIEDGWKNVFKNVLCIDATKSPLSSYKIKGKPQWCTRSTSSSLQKIPLKARRNNVIESPTRKLISDGINDNHKDLQIYTIFRNENLAVTKNDKVTIPTLNVPIYDQPCSSKHDIENHISRLSYDSDEMPDRNILINFRCEMIIEMLSSLLDENLYIQNLRDYIDFEETAKKGSDILKVLKKTRNRRNRKEIKNKTKNRKISSGIKLKVELQNELEKSYIDDTMKLNFVGVFQDRIKQRKKMLNTLLQYYENDEDLYNETLEIFINMEESLVE